MIKHLSDTFSTALSVVPVGTDAEKDSALRIRQPQSITLPALTPFDAISIVSGVILHKLYESDRKVTDANGIP